MNRPRRTSGAWLHTGSQAEQRPRARRAALLALLAVVTLTFGACVDVIGVGSRDIEIIWPRHGATLDGYETLRARLRGYDLRDYDIYWYVDDGRERRMWNEWDGRRPHKAAVVDTWYWDWRGRGPYTVGFIAEDRRGRELAHRSVRVYVR
jgi:hypothetical protein